MDDFTVLPRWFVSGLGFWITFTGIVILVLTFMWRRARFRADAYGEYISDIARTCLGNGIGLSILEQIGRGDVDDAKGWWKEFRHGVECSKKDLGQLRQDVMLLRRAARGESVQEVPADRNAFETLESIRILQAEVRNLRDTLGDRERQVAFYQGWIATLAKEAKGETERDQDLGLPDQRYGDLRAALTYIRSLWSRVNDLQSQLNAELAKPSEPKEYGESRKRLEARIEQATTSRDSALDRVAALEKDLEATRDERNRLRGDVVRLEEMKEWPGVTTFLEQASIALEAEACLDFAELLKLLVQVVARKNQLEHEAGKPNGYFTGYGAPPPSELPRFFPVLLGHVIGILEGTADRRSMFNIPAIQHQDLVLKLIEVAWTVSTTEKKQREGDAQFRNRVALELEPFFVRCHEAFFKHSSHVEHQMLQKAVQELRDRFPGTAYRPDEFAVLDSGEIVDCPELNTGSDGPSGEYRAFYVEGARAAAGCGPVPPEPEFVKLAREMRGYGWLERFRRATTENKLNEQSPGHAKAVAESVDKILDAIEAAVKNAPEMVFVRMPSVADLESRVMELEGKLKSAVEQVKLLEDLRDKMSADYKWTRSEMEAEKKNSQSMRHSLMALVQVARGETLTDECRGSLVGLWGEVLAKLEKDPLIGVKLTPARPFAIEVGKCYLAQNGVKWWIVAEAASDGGKRIYSGIARELMRHPPPSAWFHGDGHAVHSGQSSLWSEVK